MADHPEISALRQLLFARPQHPLDVIGSVVRTYRPSYLRAEPPAVPPSGFDANDLNALHDIDTNWSASVARIELAVPGGKPVRVATAFRVPGSPTRMATARHALRGMMRETLGVKSAFPFEAEHNAVLAPDYIRDNLRVNFHDTPDAEEAGVDGSTVFEVGSFVWAHYIWDLLLFDLAKDPQRPAIEVDLDWDAATGAKLAVVGYPADDSANQGLIPKEALGCKHLAMGVVDRRELGRAEFRADSRLPGERWSVRHDATTLSGSSGSPVLALGSGRLIGVHIIGGRNGGDPNWMIDLPLALSREQDLMTAFTGRPGLAGMPPRLLATLAPQITVGTAGLPESAGALLAAPWGTPELNPLLQGIVADRPDFRDLEYRPPLTSPADSVGPWRADASEIADQGLRPVCAAVAVATAVAIQVKGPRGQVSHRMLDALARQYDEWAEDTGRGTSLRAVIKAFFHNGVCRAEPAGDPEPWIMTRDRAREAREVTLGAYYRVAPDLPHMQLAVQEAGAVVVSARVHEGWRVPESRDGIGSVIGYHRVGGAPGQGGHAFVVVGYTDEGFIVRNSWGPDWGRWRGVPGHALWTYADWSDNVLDAWVMRVAPRAASAFGLVSAARRREEALPDVLPSLPKARRQALLGHAVHVEREGIVDLATLGLGIASLRETGMVLKSEAAHYRTLLFVFPDPFLGAEAIARMTAWLVPRLKGHGIYPFVVSYGLDEIRSVALRLEAEHGAAATAFAQAGQDATGYLERRATQVVARPLRDFAAGAAAAAGPGGALWLMLASLLADPGCFDGREFHRLAKPRIPAPVTLAFGCGAFAADAVAKALGLAKSRQVRVAPTVRPLDGVRVISLAGPRKAGASLPGYKGDWTHLAAAALGAGMPLVLPQVGTRLDGAGLLQEAIIDDKLWTIVHGSFGRKPAEPD